MRNTSGVAKRRINVQCSLKFNYSLVLISVGLFFARPPAVAQTSSYEELQVAYLYNFAKYIRWPEESATFVIGVRGETDIEHLQHTLQGKKVGGREIILKSLATVDESLTCHIVYLRESSSEDLNALKEVVGRKSILIVSEEDMIKKGAMISFVVEDDRLRFKLKKKALNDAGLTASEGLLKLAILL